MWIRGRRWAWVLTFAVSLTATGCSGGRKLYKVEGVVTIEGQPLTGASVVFNPMDTSQGGTASAKTEEDGSFRLYTQNRGEGALAGDYKVTVQLFPEIEREAPKPGDLEAIKKMFKLTAEEKARKHPRLPVGYGNVQTTTLTCRVPTEGTVKLDLKGKLTVK